MTTIRSVFLSQHPLRCLLILALTLCGAIAHAKDIVAVDNAWVRPTNPGQDVGAAYMTLTSTQDATLIKVESSATKSVEIHSMTMQNGVMKMRMLKNLALKAGEPYKLAPGGFHLMLFDLKKPLAVGDTVDFSLTFRDGTTEFKQQVNALVKAPDDAGHDHNAHEYHH